MTIVAVSLVAISSPFYIDEIKALLSNQEVYTKAEKEHMKEVVSMYAKRKNITLKEVRVK